MSIGAATTASGDPVLAGMVARLVEAFAPDRIYLFGSRARGDADPHSDYDLLMVLPHADGPAYKLSQDAHSLLWEFGTAADVLVWSRERFESRLHLRAATQNRSLLSPRRHGYIDPNLPP